MRVMVTGSAGHLGEGLARVLAQRGHEVVGFDRKASRFTTVQGSVCDADLLRRSLRGVDGVIHTAALHKRHLASHGEAQFATVNIEGTRTVLEAMRSQGVSALVLTSTTSTFGHGARPAADEPAALVDEGVLCVPKDVYGASKIAAEDLCEACFQATGLPIVALRVSRFYPEADVQRDWNGAADDVNHKLNDYLYRRVDLEDAVEAHILALERAPQIGFARYVVSATSPFGPRHLADLRSDAAGVLADLVPDHVRLFRRRGWTAPARIDRIYDNTRAREELGWRPRVDFAALVNGFRRGQGLLRPLAARVGAKGYD